MFIAFESARAHTKIHVRIFKFILAAFALSIVGAAPAQQRGPLEMVEISSGNFVHYGELAERSPGNLGDQANIGFIVGQRCVLVVDTGGSLPIGTALRAAIRRATGKPVCYVVITHVHPDHFFGAAAFVEDQPEFIGHENLPRQLAARARPYINSLHRDLGERAAGSEIVMPTRTIAAGDTLVLDLGDRLVEVKAWPPAHTDDDVTVYDRATRTLWLADLLFIDHTPVLDSNITGFLAVMQQLRGLDVKQYVAGHGRSGLAWPKPLDPQERYFKVILNETRAAIKNRRSLMQAVNEIGLSETGNWVNFDTFHRRNVTTAYTELEWEE